MSFIDFLPLDGESKAALKVLQKELGLFPALQMGMRLKKSEKRGEPFHQMDPSSTQKETLSRKQIAPAILLYQELKKIRSQEDALRIAEEVIIQSTLVFLRKTIGAIQRKKIASMTAGEREGWVQKTGDKFFNAEMEWREINENRVEFDVTACHFPTLCAKTGVPELAPSFCKGDAVFFGKVEPDVSFQRENTIAEGAPRCEFRMSWIKSDSDP